MTMFQSSMDLPYVVRARIFPAALGIVPFFVLYYFCLSRVIGDFIGAASGLKLVADVTIPVACFYLFTELARRISKEVFQNRIFNNGLNLPTTNFLLHLDETYSDVKTKRIHDKIYSDFGIKIPSLREESDSPIQSRKIINEAVKNILSKVKNGFLTMQHNAEYGFWRNLAGGSIISISMSLINCIVFQWIYPEGNALRVSIFLAAIYAIHLFFAKKLIIKSGHDYADILIREYLET